jgi:hypothetical protein
MFVGRTPGINAENALEGQRTAFRVIGGSRRGYVACMSESEIDPDTLTSPGTVDDPELEQERARQAAEREAESRGSDKTKFEEAREAEEAERAAAVARLVADQPSHEE